MALPQNLSDALTLDQVAALTDEEMVRRRFDAGNIRWAGAFSSITFFIAVVQVLTALFTKKSGAHFLPVSLVHIVVASAAAAFFGELAWSQRKRARFRPRLPVHLLARNFTPWVLAFAITEFTLVTFYRSSNSDSWLGWAMLFPWLLIFVRLETSRRLAIHVSILAVVVLNSLILGGKDDRKTPEYTVIVIMHAFTFVLGSAISRRLRRMTLEEWSERRKQARVQLRMRDELEFARGVQLSMLPERAPSLEWLDIAAASLPATEVGGDYYDYFVDENAVSIVCGDVAGHGLGSGIVLASLRSGFFLLRDSLGDPASVLQRLNDLVAQTSRRRMLATAAVLRLDRNSRQATLASAGHPPVIVRTARRDRSHRALRASARCPPSLQGPITHDRVPQRRCLRSALRWRIRIAKFCRRGLRTRAPDEAPRHDQGPERRGRARRSS